MKLKIMTLNIWRYDGDWQERKKRIIETVKEEQPDILFMQEVFDDARHQKNTEGNQLVQLNRELGFKNEVYDVAEQLRHEKGTEVRELVFDGLGVLTNLDIVGHEVYRLAKQKEDKHFRAIQVITVSIDGEEVTFHHVHYSNTDQWSEMHLKETMELSQSRWHTPIIVGDLNILKPDVITRICGKTHICSYDAQRYVSFPAKGEVLDYVVVPKGWRFDLVRCEADGCSDHRPLVTVISKQF